VKTQTTVFSKATKVYLARGMSMLFIASTFYSYGTAMMDYFLVYPSRALIGEAEFVAYHALLDERIMTISVYPFALPTLLNLGLFRFRLPGIPAKLVYASFVCLMLDWISTIFVQIPMNLQLNEGRDLEVIEYVMETNWGRVVLESVQMLLVLKMLWHLTTATTNRKVSNNTIT